MEGHSKTIKVLQTLSSPSKVALAKAKSMNAKKTSQIKVESPDGKNPNKAEGDQFKFEILNHENNFESGLTTSLTAARANNRKQPASQARLRQKSPTG